MYLIFFRKRYDKCVQAHTVFIGCKMLAPCTNAGWTQDARRVDPRRTQSGHTQDTPRVDAGAVDEGRMQTQWQVISWSTVLMPLKGLITRSYALAGIFKGKRVMQFLIKNGYNNKLTTLLQPSCQG